MKPDQKAAVAIVQAGEATMRPALFVFLTPDGFAWVEPAYLEPNPSRLAFHRVRGTLALQPNGFTCEADDGRTYLVGALADLEEGIGADLRQVCAWGEAQILAAGSTLEQERDRLREALADDLA